MKNAVCSFSSAPQTPATSFAAAKTDIAGLRALYAEKTLP